MIQKLEESYGIFPVLATYYHHRRIFCHAIGVISRKLFYLTNLFGLKPEGLLKTLQSAGLAANLQAGGKGVHDDIECTTEAASRGEWL
jgi:hypothetical protein